MCSLQSDINPQGRAWHQCWPWWENEGSVLRLTCAVLADNINKIADKHGNRGIPNTSGITE